MTLDEFNNSIFAQKQNITLEDLYKDYSFYPKGYGGFNSMNDGEHYVKMEINDQGQELVKYQFKNGKKVRSLFKSYDFEIPKGEGVRGLIRKKDWDEIGGNDPLFAPASWEDKDLFIRMQLEGYEFKMTSKSIVWHFSARGSHFRDEAKDNFEGKSKRQQTAEEANVKKFIGKWGQMPQEDEMTFVKPIYGTNVKTRMI